MAAVEKLQIVVDAEGPAPLCAGLPPAVRAAHRAAVELPEARLLVACSPRRAQRWSRQLAQARADVSGRLSADSPLLAVSSDGFADEGALARFVEDARRSGKASRGLSGGRVVAAYLPRAGALAGLPTAAAAAETLGQAGEGISFEGWSPCATKAEAAAAEKALCDALAKDTDGYIARFDRRVSIAVSRVLLRLPVTPNQITTASLLIGLAGAWGLATGSYSWQLAGGLALWCCCILDGCDGEVARLKLMSSPSGAAYDLAADHVSHLATFIAIPVGLHRARPELAFWGPGALLVTGVALSAFSVWWLVLRLPQRQRGPLSLLIERVASRDYVYLILACVAIGRLRWFLWAAGLGSHAFYLALWRVAARGLRKPLPAA